MKPRAVLVPIIAAALVACGQPPSPAPVSFPPAPAPPAGWVSLASGGSDTDVGFSGFRVATSGRPLALNVACRGSGTLVVSYGREPGGGSAREGGTDAVVFPCSMDAGVTMRREIAPDLGAGEISVDGGVVPGAGQLAPSVFMVSLEEAAP